MHGFGYVGRMIAHPLDILGAKDQMHAEYHGSGILDHVREQLAKKRSIYAVNVLVTGPNFDRFCHISAGETIQHIPQLLQHQGRHVSHSAEVRTWLTNNAWYRNSTPWLESGEMRSARYQAHWAASQVRRGDALHLVRGRQSCFSQTARFYSQSAKRAKSASR